MDSSGSVQEQVVGFCEHGNEQITVARSELVMTEVICAYISHRPIVVGIAQSVR